MCRSARVCVCRSRGSNERSGFSPTARPGDWEKRNERKEGQDENLERRRRRILLYIIYTYWIFIGSVIGIRKDGSWIYLGMIVLLGLCRPVLIQDSELEFMHHHAPKRPSFGTPRHPAPSQIASTRRSQIASTREHLHPTVGRFAPYRRITKHYAAGFVLR